MNFEEWLKENSANPTLSDEMMLRFTWNAALDEAVKVAKEHYDETWAGEYQLAGNGVAKAIKELKG